MAFNTIRIQTDAPTKEGKASGAITPGHLLERTSAADTVKVHATAGIKSGCLFAIEDGWQGKTIADAYVTTTKVFFIAAQRGDIIYARIANGEAIAIGDLLVSNGNGELKEHTKDSSGTIVEEYVIGQALTACDMSGSSAVDPTNVCQVEIW